MNPYFWLFALYALWITPVEAGLFWQWNNDGFRYHARYRVGGVPLPQRCKAKKKGDGPANKLALLWKLYHQGHMRCALRAWHLQNLRVQARISFEDAALTALAFAFLRTVLQRPIRQITGHIEADFRAQGTQCQVECIISSRLGMLMVAAIRLYVAARQIRGRTKEAEYAAASH